MASRAVENVTRLSDTQEVARATGNIATRRIWLPKLLYDALPYFYIAAGISAFLATLYISEWFWVLPHYVLFSAACLHLGCLVIRRRSRRVFVGGESD